MNLAPGGGEWSSSLPGLFNPREIAPGTYWIEGWVGPSAVLDAMVNRKIASHRQKSNPRTVECYFKMSRSTTRRHNTENLYSNLHHHENLKIRKKKENYNFIYIFLPSGLFLGTMRSDTCLMLTV
jgi:DNA-dependent RNA polymerase auxiliary subunit epsilon